MNHDLLIDKETKISYFNPLRRKIFHKNKKIQFLKYFLPKSRLNNFGDLLGPIIVKAIMKEKIKNSNPKFLPNKFLTVGSILHYAEDGDHIWGTGINGKKKDIPYPIKNLNVTLVRGPLTRKFLVNLGIECPEIYGDPGLLLSNLFPRYQKNNNNSDPKILFIPNYNESHLDYKVNSVKTISPLNPIKDIIDAIANSEFVISSSLHAVIIAESYGIGARFLNVKRESPFKYIDYLQGTGRFEYLPAESIEHAMNIGPQSKPIFNIKKLLNSFPKYLYSDNKKKHLKDE